MLGGKQSEEVEMMEPVRKPLTAYFIYMMEQRREGSNKLSTKDLSAVWGSMTQEERKIYIEKSEKMKEEYNAYLLQNPLQTTDEVGTGGGTGPEEFETGQNDPSVIEDAVNMCVPVHKIKAILKQDEEMAEANIKQEAYRYLQQATYMFMSDIIYKSMNNMRKNRKKKVMGVHMANVCNEEYSFNWILDTNILYSPGQRAEEELQYVPIKPSNIQNALNNRFGRPNSIEVENKKMQEEVNLSGNLMGKNHEVNTTGVHLGKKDTKPKNTNARTIDSFFRKA